MKTECPWCGREVGCWLIKGPPADLRMHGHVLAGDKGPCKGSKRRITDAIQEAIKREKRATKEIRQELEALKDAWPRCKNGHPVEASAFRHEVPCSSCGIRQLDGNGHCLGCGRERG